MSGAATDRARRILRERAEALARPPRDAAARRHELLVARVGRRRVAVPLERAREVLGPGPLAWVPGAPPAVLGVRSVRGELLAVADLGSLLGIGVEAPETGHVLVIHHHSAPLGLLVDGVEGVRAVERRGEPGEAGADLVTGILSDDEGDVILLDHEALLADPRAGAARWEGPAGGVAA